VQKFLPFTNYYLRFVKNFSLLALPLYKHLKNQKTIGEIHWCEGCKASILSIIDCLSREAYLRQPTEKSEFTIETDASKKAIAAIVYIKESRDGKVLLLPAAIYFRTLTASELNYSTHEKELLSIVEVFRKYRHWLHGENKIKVRCHNQSLEHLRSFKPTTTSRMERQR
jgi:RNase H-like domain found in reverse transcriptase